MADNSKTPRRGRGSMDAATSRRGGEAEAPEQAPVRVKQARMTLDIEPELYRQLTGWTRELAAEMDVTRVTVSAAVRAMIRLTLADPDTAAKVRGLL